MTDEAKRTMALLALAKLSASIRSDLLSQGSLAGKYDISCKKSIKLEEDVVLPREELFAAFRQASRKAQKITLPNEVGGTVALKLFADERGGLILETKTRRWCFEYAALLSPSPDCRRRALDQCLSGNSLLTSCRDSLVEKVESSALSDEEFFQVASILGSAPEAFGRNLRETLMKGTIRKEDLIPDDERYWDHLVCPVETSNTLSQFIRSELARERSARLALDPVKLFEVVTLTCAAPSLVPHSLFGEMSTDTLVHLLELGADFDDPFGVAGAFDLCAENLGRDGRLAQIGEKLIDKICLDLDKLQSSCEVFAAGFIIGAAHLASHETLGSRPVFWRRLVAASHASLIVRVAGRRSNSDSELVSWAMGVAGRDFALSVLNEFSVEPRWRPEWINSQFLFADVLGRVLLSMQRAGGNRAPRSWQERENSILDILSRRKLHSLAFLPAVLESDRLENQPRISDIGEVSSLLRKWVEKPSREQFLSLAPVFCTLGVPKGVSDSASVVVEQLRRDVKSVDNQEVQNVLVLASYIAVQVKDVTLADKVADFCVQRSLFAKEVGTVGEMVRRVVECSSASTDRAKARLVLAQRLEALAFGLEEPDLVAALLEQLVSLKRVEPELAPLLGQAFSAAALGKHQLSRIS